MSPPASTRRASRGPGVGVPGPRTRDPGTGARVGAPVPSRRDRTRRYGRRAPPGNAAVARRVRPASVLCAIAVLAAAPAAAQEPAAPSGGTDTLTGVPPIGGALVEADRGREDPLLVLYPSGPALVTERLAFRLDAGLNTVRWTDPPDALDPSSLALSFPGDDPPAVLESAHRPAAAALDDALRGLVGREVSLGLEDGRRVRGTLVSAQDPLVLRPAASGEASSGGGAPGPATVVPRDRVRDYSLPALPAGFRPGSEVAWHVRAAEPGRREAEVAYLSGGLSWDAEYVLELGADEERLGLDGWAVLHNGTTRAYREARVKLVAGDVQRAAEGGRGGDARALRARTEAAAFDAGPAQAEATGFGPHRLFELPREVTVEAGGEVRSLLLRAGGVPVRKELVVAGGPDRGFAGRDPVVSPETGTEQQTDHAAVHYAFSTGGDGVDRDLPSGRVRVYRRDDDGDLLLEGEDALPDVPRGDSARVVTGRAFRVVRERTQTAFRRPDPGSIEEAFGLTLRNEGDEAVEVRVLEHLHRWREWEVVEATLDGEPAGPRKVDVRTVEWRVRVPAGGERSLDYTVRYTFPPDLRR